MLRLAIVDDDMRVAYNLREALAQYPELSEITISDSGLEYARDLEMRGIDLPDVIIMDISMAQPDEGIQATRRIKHQFPSVEVIIFTISEEDESIFEAFKAGAMGYLLKNEDPAFIYKTILDVKNGGAQMSPSIARKAIHYLAPPAKPEKFVEDEPSEALTARETEVLEYVGKGLTYPAIADQLNIATHTVKKHMMNVFHKLQVKNKIEALKKVERM